MSLFFCRTVWTLVGLVYSANLTPTTAEETSVEFNRDIRPILSDKCLACHGSDAKSRAAELRLDIDESVTRGGESGPAIVPGDPESSLLIQRIRAQDADQRMPPASSHKELSTAEIDLLTAWIRQGAKYQLHWAYEPPQSPVIPVVEKTVVSNAVDAFILERLRSLNQSIAPPADKSILIRRVSFALTGLPPTIAEQRAFFDDPREDAYESMVERYLQSPRYGEEMARHWLDVARYADTHGMHLDNERQTWAYRDWVVSAFNRNLPFDQFTIEQLAGDLLPNATQDQLVATGFSRCNVTSSEGGSIPEELLYRYAVDRTSTTMSAWLGLTGGCAVCHDHKFDPISQKEFYSMYAFFNSAADPAMDGNALLTQPTLKLESDHDRSKLQQLDQQKSAAVDQIAQRAASISYADPADAIPRPERVTSQTIWMDDSFPNDGKVQHAGAPTQFVDSSAAIQPFSGSKLLKRTDAGLAQDVWETDTSKLLVPDNAKFVAHVWIDPANKPKSIMIQFNRGGWNHRAVWGDYGAIDWGAPQTHQRVHMGELPEAGAWVKLQFQADQVGISSGDKLDGFALTQHGGTVYWDQVGVDGAVDRAADGKYSLSVWLNDLLGQDSAKVPEAIRQAVQQIKLDREKTKAAAGSSSAEAKSAELESNLASVRAYYLSKVCVETISAFSEIQGQLANIEAQRKSVEDAIPSTFIYRDLPQPRESFVMMRGAYNRPAEKVQPAVLEILPPLKLSDPSKAATRLDLARWLVSDEQPLTARVIVNRFWQQFFGVGLVKTSYDFGSQGELPSHPQLLDWLAVNYQQSGWDTKGLVRLLLNSQTFKQSSSISVEQYNSDPENRLYARGPRFRLDAEPIRDNALFVSGLLDLTMGGPGVKPYQPVNIWEPVGFAGSNTRFYKQDNGAALYRRSLYTFYKRTAPPPFMVNFDAPNREQLCARRERSNTPLQALQLMNDIQYVEAARNWAVQLSNSQSTFEQQLQHSFQSLLCRSPNENELSILRSQYEFHLSRFTNDVEAAKKLLSLGESKLPENLNLPQLASLTMICNTLLNLDEAVTRN
jgi:Protein of unknown function (DUF1553)/Protein of unknown function (DUF1549)/Planctomycete cytochrome C